MVSGTEKSMYGKKYMGVTRSHVVVLPRARCVDVQIKVSPEESIKRALTAIDEVGEIRWLHGLSPAKARGALRWIVTLQGRLKPCRAPAATY
jgi:hypothetical protein